MIVVTSRRPSEALQIVLPGGQRVVVTADRNTRDSTRVVLKVDAPNAASVLRIGGPAEPAIPTPYPREGHIHLQCPGCGLERANQQRAEWDPAEAVLLVTYCPECAAGAKDGAESYFDAAGDAVDQLPEHAQ